MNRANCSRGTPADPTSIESEAGDNRAFGLIVGAAFAILGGTLLYRSGGQSVVGMASAALGIALAIAGLLVPLRLTQLNRTWHKLSSILASVMNPLVLTVLYVTTILPAALLMRGLRRDPLRLKIDPTAKSYWVERTPPGPARDSMRDQF